MQSISVIGEALVDIVRKDNTETLVPGGSPANVALGLARLGHPARLTAWLGQDEKGKLVADHLKSSQVELPPANFLAPRTSTAIANIGDDGSAEYQFDLEWNIPQPELRATDILVHTGSIAATMQPGAKAVYKALSNAQTQATISYDPNARPVIMGDAKTARAQILPIMELADVIKMSDEDVEYFFAVDVHDPQARAAFATEILAKNVQLLIITAGSMGAYAYTKGGLSYHQPVNKVKAADTVGAGDSFMGGILSALWHLELLGAEKRDALGRMSQNDLQRLMSYASKIADVTVSRTGANPPYATEITFI